MSRNANFRYNKRRMGRDLDGEEVLSNETFDLRAIDYGEPRKGKYRFVLGTATLDNCSSNFLWRKPLTR